MTEDGWRREDPGEEGRGRGEPRLLAGAARAPPRPPRTRPHWLLGRPACPLPALLGPPRGRSGVPSARVPTGPSGAVPGQARRGVSPTTTPGCRLALGAEPHPRDLWQDHLAHNSRLPPNSPRKRPASRLPARLPAHPCPKRLAQDFPSPGPALRIPRAKPRRLRSLLPGLSPAQPPPSLAQHCTPRPLVVLSRAGGLEGLSPACPSSREHPLRRGVSSPAPSAPPRVYLGLCRGWPPHLGACYALYFNRLSPHPRTPATGPAPQRLESLAPEKR